MGMTEGFPPPQRRCPERRWNVKSHWKAGCQATVEMIHYPEVEQRRLFRIRGVSVDYICLFMHSFGILINVILIVAV